MGTNGHKLEFLLAEQNFPVPPSPLFRNDAAALPPRYFRRCTCDTRGWGDLGGRGRSPPQGRTDRTGRTDDTYAICPYKKAYIKTYKKNVKIPSVNPLLKLCLVYPPLWAPVLTRSPHMHIDVRDRGSISKIPRKHLVR